MLVIILTIICLLSFHKLLGLVQPKTIDHFRRWDINAIKEIPDYMKICFLGFYNTINEIAYKSLINTGLLTLPYLTKAVINPALSV